MEVFSEINIEVGLEPREYVVRPIIERRSIYVCSGESGSGKTTILEALGYSAAHARPFGAYEFDKPVNVAWIGGEDSYNGQARMMAMLQHWGDSPTGRFAFFPTTFSILNRSDVAWFRKGLDKAFGSDIGLIVIDSKSVLWGGKDENSNSEASSFMAAVRHEFVGPYGAAVCIIHHVTKRRNAPNAPEQSARGASALLNDADAEIRFSSTKSGRMTMEPGMKLRGRRWAPIHFDNQFVSLDRVLYPSLMDGQGFMPEVNIAVPAGTATKVSARGAPKSEIAERLDEEERMTYLRFLVEASRRGIRVPHSQRGSTAFHALAQVEGFNPHDSPAYVWESLEDLVARGLAQVVTRRNSQRQRYDYFEATDEGRRICEAYWMRFHHRAQVTA